MNNIKFYKKEFKKVLSTSGISNIYFNFFKSRNAGICSNCEENNNYYIKIKLKPDFNTSILPSYIEDKFLNREFGYCKNCGLSQTFNRLTKLELLEYIRILSDKDQTVSEEVFHSWPIPNDFVNKINRTIFQKRSLNIINKIQNLGFKPSSSLFLRPVFGYLYDIISHNFTIAASAIEISSRAKRYCVEKYPNLNFIEGNLHGYIKIDVSNKFDSIFCFHSLIHSINFLDDLKYLKSILDDGGFIVFSEEVISKPYNPFHILHTTDNIFEEILRKHFSNVIKLEDCEERGINLSCEKVTDSKTACDFIVSNPIF